MGGENFFLISFEAPYDFLELPSNAAIRMGGNCAQVRRPSRKGPGTSEDVPRTAAI